MNPAFVLMYHRVCPRTDATAPWFARGTAVTPEAFALQVRWLAERFEWVEATRILEQRDRTAISITFDDGYADIVEHVAPVCQEHGITATCFASAGPALHGRALWFDVWYATASRMNADVAEWFAQHGLRVPASPEEWARGAAKGWLASLRTDHRIALVRDLEARRDAPDAPRYLGAPDLQQLLRAGWTIGGHGVDHHPLSNVDDGVAGRELQGSTALLDQVGATRPRLFAYPDGAHDAAARARVRAAGFDVAFTVEAGAVTLGVDSLAVPRLFARGDGPVPHPIIGSFE